MIDVQTGKPLNSLVSNDGKLSANGGRVELTAAAARAVVNSVINNKGVIEANSVGMRNGKIVLGGATGASKPAGAPTQIVKIAGTISASGKAKGTKGGTIVVTGEHIQVAGAKIDASGDAGGGKVMLGGDWGGGNPNRTGVNNQSASLESYTIANATTLSVDAATTIDASAKSTGNGGKVILWSDSRPRSPARSSRKAARNPATAASSRCRASRESRRRVALAARVRLRGHGTAHRKLALTGGHSGLLRALRGDQGRPLHDPASRSRLCRRG